LRQKPLLEFLGDVPLREIDYNLVENYKTYRAPHVQVPTTNRELSLLRFLLTCAVKRGVLRAIPAVELQDESGRARERSVSEEEYHDIRAGMGREQERIVIGWWETAQRHEEPFNIRWPMIDKVGLFKLPAHILKEKFPRRTPISYEMREILEELRDEQRRNKIQDMHGYVFTRRDGRRIRDITKAFALALERAKLQKSGITPHSFRKACITRWTNLGVPRDFVMLFSGHRSSGVHDEYLRFTDAMLVSQFREKGLLLPPEQRKTAESV
jgi:integrase